MKMTLEELREQIAKYIGKEIALMDTPSYALTASEMSYGILYKISQVVKELPLCESCRQSILKLLGEDE